jgi:hypothetical protein
MAVLNGHHISQVLPVAEAKQPVTPADIRQAWRSGHPAPALVPAKDLVAAGKPSVLMAGSRIQVR